MDVGVGWGGGWGGRGGRGVRGANDSDHNSIIIEMEIAKAPKQIGNKYTVWNIRAPNDKVDLFQVKLASSIQNAEEIMADRARPMTARYTAWENLLYKAAISSIGKRTIRADRPPMLSNEIKKLRNERRALKRLFEEEKCPCKKKQKLDDYMKKQKEIKEKMMIEESQKITTRMEKMDQRSGGFWKERKLLKKDTSSSWLITKDPQGKRIYDPEKNKENVANYYEDLYSINVMWMFTY